MNTPTPRTDEARRIDNGDTRPLLDEMETMERELAAERARLDSGQILLTVAGERVWHSGVDLRAAIDAGMREGAK